MMRNYFGVYLRDDEPFVHVEETEALGVKEGEVQPGRISSRSGIPGFGNIDVLFLAHYRGDLTAASYREFVSQLQGINGYQGTYASLFNLGGPPDAEGQPNHLFNVPSLVDIIKLFETSPLTQRVLVPVSYSSSQVRVLGRPESAVSH